MAWLEYPTGWIPDPPDRRDFDPGDERLAKRAHRPLVAQTVAKIAVADETPLQPRVDLTRWFPDVDNQVPLNSCTASAAAALLAYFERKAFDNHVVPSRMFLYKVQRNLLRQTGDGGAFLRIAMKALRAFGVAPEEYWPYDARLLDVEPSPFHYAFAANYKAISYFRLDRGANGDALVEAIRRTLAGSFPAMFGIALVPSFEQAGTTGRIQVPFPWERTVTLHALVATGYDDELEIRSQDPFSRAVVVSRGAFRVRNSWGREWGEGGYGWLPYDYVRRGLTCDWWSLTKAEYLDTGEFGPGTAPEGR